jgi:hypothetical protein
MKFSSKIYFRTLASLALSLVAATAMAQTTKDRIATVNALAGDARYSQKGGAYMPIAVGTKLREGDKVKTGVGSHVDIDIGGNVGIIQVAPQSELIIGKLTSTDSGSERLTETQLRVELGAIYAKINKLAKGSRYEIATPKGIAGIRGTAVYCTADCQLTVVDGYAGVAFINGGGAPDTYRVLAGETVGPNDKPPHAAPGYLLRDIVEALRDASTHGIGYALPPYVPPVDIFISPTLPVDVKSQDIPPID